MLGPVYEKFEVSQALLYVWSDIDSLSSTWRQQRKEMVEVNLLARSGFAMQTEPVALRGKQRVQQFSWEVRKVHVWERGR